jgi:hypothetical protein
MECEVIGDTWILGGMVCVLWYGMVVGWYGMVGPPPHGIHTRMLSQQRAEEHVRC